MLELQSVCLEQRSSDEYLSKKLQSNKLNTLYNFNVPFNTIIKRLEIDCSKNARCLLLGTHSIVASKQIAKIMSKFKLTQTRIETQASQNNESVFNKKRLNYNLQNLASECSLIQTIVKSDAFNVIIDFGLFDSITISLWSDKQYKDVLTNYASAILSALDENSTFILFSLPNKNIYGQIQELFNDKPVKIRISTILKNNEYMVCYCFTKTDATENNVEYRLCAITKCCLLTYSNIDQLSKITNKLVNKRFLAIRYSKHVPWRLEELRVVDEDTETTKYEVVLFDNVAVEKEKPFQNCTTCLLVPPAEQHHWLYKKKHGIKKLADRLDCQRILLVFFRECENFKDRNCLPKLIETLKVDLHEVFTRLNLRPELDVQLACQQQDFTDERETIKTFNSEFSGEIVVFDTPIAVDDDEFSAREDIYCNSIKPYIKSDFTRRVMVLSKSPRCSQSEVWYKHTVTPHAFYFEHICHAYMIEVLTFIIKHQKVDTPEKINICLLGLGGGVLASILNAVMQDKVDMTCIEIDPIVKQIALECFDFKESSNCRVEITDGVDYIVKTDKKFDIIIVDINGTHENFDSNLENVTAPPPEFLQGEFLEELKAKLNSNGVVIINSVCQDDRSRELLGTLLSYHFSTVSSLRYINELNEVFACTIDACDRPREKVTRPRALFKQLVSFTNLYNFPQKTTYPKIAELTKHNPLYLSKHSVNKFFLSYWR